MPPLQRKAREYPSSTRSAKMQRKIGRGNKTSWPRSPPLRGTLALCATTPNSLLSGTTRTTRKERGFKMCALGRNWRRNGTKKRNRGNVRADTETLAEGKQKAKDALRGCRSKKSRWGNGRGNEACTLIVTVLRTN